MVFEEEEESEGIERVMCFLSKLLLAYKYISKSKWKILVIIYIHNGNSAQDDEEGKNIINWAHKCNK